MKAKITRILLLLSVVVLSGCLSTNPDKAQQTISHWIPPGTPQEDAIRIMKQHGFECGKDERRPDAEETVFWFSRETKIVKNMWWFYVHFKHGKVVSIDGLGTGNDFFGPHHIPSRG